MTADDMVPVRRDDLRDALAWLPPVSGPDRFPSLFAAVNGDATTVEHEYRVVARGGHPTHVGPFPTHAGARQWADDIADTPEGPHRVERRTRASIVGPWTTQETP